VYDKKDAQTIYCINFYIPPTINPYPANVENMVSF